MGIFNGCLLVSDIDGTLYEKGAIPQRNIRALEYFKQEGGRFSIATGRGPSAGVPICQKAGVNAPVLFSNGSVIYDVWEKKILQATYLNDECKALAYAVADKFPQVGVEFTLADKIATINDTDDTRFHRKYEHFEYAAYPRAEAEKMDWIKSLLMTSDPELIHEMRCWVSANKPQDCTLIITSPIYYEILPPAVSKAEGLRPLAEICKAECGKIFCIGDYYNDLEMVVAADIGAFAAAAPDDLKAQADFIAGSAEDGAVADFIYHIEKLLKNGLV